MSSSSAAAFIPFATAVAAASATGPGDDYLDYDAFSSYAAADDSSFVTETPIYAAAATDFSPDPTGFSENGPILPPPMEMGAEEGFLLREWRRQNAIKLEEKEKREKELVNQIRNEADDYIIEFYKRRQINCDLNKVNNREKEKLFLTNQEKFHAEVDKNYWKAIGELVPHELPTIEKKKGKKEKSPIVIVQGPKPGKPTDLSRMRHILLKLKHSPPLHMKPPPAAPAKDAKPAVAEPHAAVAAILSKGKAVAVA